MQELIKVNNKNQKQKQWMIFSLISCVCKKLLCIAQYHFSLSFTIFLMWHYNIQMNQHKNMKNIQANLDFLKRFQGKKTIITKEGLISSLQMQLRSPELPLNSKKSKIKYQPQIQQTKRETNNKHHIKLIETEPSTNMEIPSRRLNFANSQMLLRQKRPQQGSKLSNRSERVRYKEYIDGQFGFNLVKQSQNKWMGLPRLKKSYSDRRISKNGEFVLPIYENISNKRNRSGSLPNYKNQIKFDLNAVNHLQQLEKFQANLRDLKQKSSRGVERMRD